MVDAEDVAEARSFISARVTDSPRPAASRAMPQPLIPPPMTKRSTVSVFGVPGTVSSYAIGEDGGLTLLESVAGETEHPENIQGSTPLDARISQDGRYLYVVLPGSGKVAGWRIMDDGKLAKLGEYAGLPQTVNGDHAPFDFSALGSPAGIEAI